MKEHTPFIKRKSIFEIDITYQLSAFFMKEEGIASHVILEQYFFCLCVQSLYFINELR